VLLSRRKHALRPQTQQRLCRELLSIHDLREGRSLVASHAFKSFERGVISVAIQRPVRDFFQTANESGNRLIPRLTADSESFKPANRVQTETD
jgi:hypothetical protein